MFVYKMHFVKGKYLLNKSLKSSFVTVKHITSTYQPIEVPNIPVEEKIFQKFDKFAGKIAIVSAAIIIITSFNLFLQNNFFKNTY